MREAFMGWVNRLTALFRRGRLERDLNEELRHHIRLKTQENIEAGMPPEEARFAALRAFGGIEQKKEQCRDADRLRWLEELIQDLRYGLRQLRRNPGFTAVAFAVLALGIGANAAMFSVIDAALLRPLPFKNSGRVVSLSGVFARRMRIVHTPKPHIELEVENWVKETRTLENVSYFQTGKINLAGWAEPERVAAAAVSERFFQLLGVTPGKGRTFLPQEESGDQPEVAILSYGLWKSRYGSDPRILGKNLLVNGRPCTVIGIMPRGFSFPAGTALWLPLTREASAEFGGVGVINSPLARLQPGVTRHQARAELTVLHQINEFGPHAKRPPIEVIPLHQALVGNTRPALMLLSAAVLLVLLIACADVASLMLARGAARTREISVRAALGASRGRLIRQMLTESTLLGCLGGCAAVPVVWWMTDLARRLASPHLALIGAIRMNGWVLVVCMALAVSAGVLCGVLPARQVARADLHERLKEGGVGNRSGRAAQLRSQCFLVVGETALAVVLLIGAGLLIRSFVSLLNFNTGFSVNNLLTAQVSLLGPKWTPPELRTFYQTVVTRVEALPRVKSAALASQLPLTTYGRFPVKLEGQPAKSAKAVYFAVSPDYFKTLGVPLLTGRVFTESECQRGERLAVISEAMAKRYWPGESPVGNRFRLNWWPPSPDFTVIGVVGQVRGKFSLRPEPQMYVPIGTEPVNLAWLVVRTSGSPLAVAPSLREIVSDVASSVPLSSVSTVKQMISRSIASPRFRTLLLGAFAALALLLAVVGIYGVVSFSVGLRTHEIGVRMALGAQKRDVLKMVLGSGVKLALIGIVIGIAAAFGLTRFLASLLYGVKPTDPLTFVAVSLILIAVALLACYIPARRATKVDPMVALRHE